VEWLNYPPNSVQFFIRGDPNEDWQMSGAHRQGMPPPVDPEVYSDLIDSIEQTTEISYPSWFLPTMAFLAILDTIMLSMILVMALS
ncbi:MAG: hypothetical protein QF817_04595, partial [Candidatus Poseidoniaceae archaeon]|nr:hypothetical protein [Candidatus Poseidoniaceae archaeon]